MDARGSEGLQVRDGALLQPDDIGGVPAGKATDELRAAGKKYFEQTKEVARKVNAGDKVLIGYQRDRMVIVGVRVESIVGEGSLSIEKEPADGE